MRVSKIIGISLFIFTLWSCTKKLTPEEYIHFVSDPKNGLRKDQSLSDIEISVMYEPVEYMLSTELPLSDYEKRKKELSDYEHFQVRLKLKTGGNILQYKQDEINTEITRVYHYSFDARRDFILVSDKDTSYCKLAHYSRNYNLSPTIDLSIAFDQTDKQNDWQLIFTDDQFSLGRVKFLFKKEDLENLPYLKK